MSRPAAAKPRSGRFIGQRFVTIGQTLILELLNLNDFLNITQAAS